MQTISTPTRAEKTQQVSSQAGRISSFNNHAADLWNRGELEAFCELYAKDTAVMVTRDGVFWGREEILASYRKAHPTRESMGRISVQLVSLQSQSTSLPDESILAVAIMRCIIVREGQSEPEVGYSMVSFAISDERICILQDTST